MHVCMYKLHTWHWHYWFSIFLIIRIFVCLFIRLQIKLILKMCFFGSDRTCRCQVQLQLVTKVIKYIYVQIHLQMDEVAENSKYKYLKVLVKYSTCERVQGLRAKLFGSSAGLKQSQKNQTASHRNKLPVRSVLTFLSSRQSTLL